MTSQSNLVVVGLAFPGNPYNGDTLAIQLSQVKRVTGRMPEDESVNLGYHGQSVRFASLHFRAESRSECEAELCRVQHANHPDEDQNFLRRFLEAIGFLQWAGKTISFLSFRRCCPHA